MPRPNADDSKDETATTQAEAAGSAALSDAKDNVESAAKKSAAALNETGHSMLGAFQELTEAYQQIASRNSERLTESLNEFGAIKGPVELIQLQQKLVKEAFENALADNKQIGEITLSIFTRAFEPMKKNIAAATQHTRSQSSQPYR